MRGIVGLIVGLGIALVGVSCKQKSETYCCTGDATVCPTRVECTDPMRMFCDMVGVNGGEKRTCITDPEAPDGGGACEMAEDCTDPGTTVCIDHRCVACQDENTCTPGAPVCQTDHTCGGCTAEAECERFAGTPHCGSEGACVGCRTGEAGDCDLTSNKPMCDDESDRCRGCLADAECSSGLCDEDTGACVREEDIIFVDSAAPGGVGCGTAAAPCRTINAEALPLVSGTRMWIRVADRDDYMERLLIDGKKVHIVGPGAELQPGGALLACVVVTGESDVTIEGMRFFGASGSEVVADGVRCSLGSASQPPRLVLRDVTIEFNLSQGIEASSCDVTVIGSTIRKNPAGGISVAGGSLTMARSRVQENGGGGVKLDSADFSMLNNFVVKNGSSDSTFGGVYVNGNPPGGSAGARFDFNTVSGNDVGGGFASGVRCQVTNTLSFKNNIVYANELAGTVGQVDFTNCNWSFSDIGPGLALVPGMGNKDIDPAFLNPSSSEYHLGGASQVMNAAENTDSVREDFDGDERPQSGGWDMGADEVMPK